jgi:hypothetical protein
LRSGDHARARAVTRSLEDHEHPPGGERQRRRPARRADSGDRVAARAGVVDEPVGDQGAENAAGGERAKQEGDNVDSARAVIVWRKAG